MIHFHSFIAANNYNFGTQITDVNRELKNHDEVYDDDVC